MAASQPRANEQTISIQVSTLIPRFRLWQQKEIPMKKNGRTK
jgi:hypothetical protein